MSICNAIIVAEVELSRIAVQVLFTSVLVDALHPALEYGESALARGGVDVAAYVIVGPVLHGAMLCKLAADPNLVRSLICHEAGFDGDVLAEERRGVEGLRSSTTRERARPVSRFTRESTSIL